MTVSIARLRTWFALAAVLVVVVVAGFYLYAHWQVNTALRQVPQKLGVEIQQSSQGFTLSKSEQGRTLYTIHAAKTIQFKEGGRAQLNNVSIVIYGKQSNRFDQIYGDNFDYDPRSGDVIAKGIVHIDLQGNAEGPVSPDQAPPKELKNPIHIKTVGLIFNQKSGAAYTSGAVEFRLPQASGTALGAAYDSKANSLTLQSQVDITTSGPKSTHILAARGVVTKQPRQTVLDQPHIIRDNEDFQSDKGTLFLRPDNTVERMLAEGNLRGDLQGATHIVVRAPQGDFLLKQHNLLSSGMLSGGVTLEASGAQSMQGGSRRVYLTFGDKNQVTKVHAVQSVKLFQRRVSTAGRAPQAVNQPAAPEQPAEPRWQDLELDADIVDFNVQGGKRLDTAHTGGAAQIVITTPPPPPKPDAKPAAVPPANVRTVVTAGRFDARFDDKSRIQSVHGAPNARIVSTSAGKPDRVSTSRVLDALFNPAGAMDSITQTDHVHYTEARRAGWADKAFYTPADETLLLTGSPRVVDGGMTTTAQAIRMDHKSGQAFANNDVKTTYSELKPQPNGAMLASQDPIQVTSQDMTAEQGTGIALYTGGARLWQDANVVQAPSIEFDHHHRIVIAHGMPQHRVATLLVQTDKKGRVTPVNVTSDRLTYWDELRKAHFEGGVVAKGRDATLTCDQADAYLLPKGQKPPSSRPSGTSQQASQLDKLVAEGNVVVVQPTRRGTGELLVYTAADEKYVLTGGPPSIFDAERGTTTGSSLTFYNRDDRVLVEGNDSSPAVTQTRVAK